MEDAKDSQNDIQRELAELRKRFSELETSLEEYRALCRELRASERYFQAMVENTMDVITLLDSEGKVLYNSPSLTDLIGYEQHELNGRNVFELVHPDDITALLETFARGIESPGTTDYVTYRFRCKDGSWGWYESVANNLLSEPGVNAVVVSSRSIGERMRFEEELRESEEYFRALIENNMDIITVIDQAGTFKFINQAGEWLLGYQQEDLIGRSSLDFVHPEDAPKALDIIKRAGEDSGFSPQADIRVKRSDGSYLYFEGIGRSYLDNPAIEGIVVGFRDVSDRKRVEDALRESEELHRALVNISPDAITMTDLEANVTFVSPRTLALHGFEKEEEILGKSALQFIAPEDHEKAIQGLSRTLEQGYVRNAEFVFVRKDGTRFVAELNAALIRDPEGKPAAFVAFTRDITERKTMERELQTRNEELEAFAHTISHDLQTPVAIVEGYAKAALEADAEGRTEAERECLESIIKGARRMSGLINSLLQYAQAGHLDMEEVRVEPEEVLLEVLTDLEPELQAKGLQVSVAEDLPVVLADPVKMRQVFYNLIGNAAKFASEDDKPRVEIGARREKDVVTFHVKDNGVGIPRSYHDRIFEPFKRFHDEGSRGLGIGLSTVKRAVEAWGGRVWVESDVGEGASFYFTVPAVEE